MIRDFHHLTATVRVDGTDQPARVEVLGRQILTAQSWGRDVTAEARAQLDVCALLLTMVERHARDWYGLPRAQGGPVSAASAQVST